MGKKTPTELAEKRIQEAVKKMTPRQRARLERQILREQWRDESTSKRREVYGCMNVEQGKNTVLAIGDLHCPYQHPDAMDFLDALAQKYQPDVFVCMGDEVDQHALSRHVHDPELFSAGMEHDAACDELQWLFDAYPQMIVCESNHPVRYLKRAFIEGVPERFLKQLKSILGAPAGWKWVERHTIDGITYEHGEQAGGMHVLNNYAREVGYSVCFGHHHSVGGVSLIRRIKDTVWGIATGCLVDPASLAMAYGKNFRRKPVLGSAVIVKGIPTWHPMLTDHRGRWIGAIT